MGNDAVNFGLDHQDEIMAGASAAWDAVSDMGWAQRKGGKGGLGAVLDGAQFVLDNQDAIADGAGAVADFAGDAWEEVTSWDWAQNGDLLGDAVNFGLDHQDEIMAGASAAWDAVSDMGWAQNKDLLGD